MTKRSRCFFLIQNQYTKHAKFRLLGEAFQRAADRLGLEMEAHGNADLLCHLRLDGGLDWPEALRRPDFVLFWDKDVRLAALLERMGLRLYNSASAIASCDDKAATHLALKGRGIAMPETLLAPLCFAPDGLPSEGTGAWLEAAEERLGYPLIAKACYGSFGQDVHLIGNRAELEAQIRAFGRRPFLLQRYVAASAGRDIRVQVLGGEPIAAVRRKNSGDFRANVTNGGTMSPIRELGAILSEWSRRISEALRLDFGGMDFLEDGRGGYLLCEVNSNAHFINLDSACGTDTALRILSYCAAQTEEKRHAAAIPPFYGRS